MKNYALFLDRDGVVNIDYGYVSSSDCFHFHDGIFDLVLAANQSNYLTVIVTNQSGIGRGLYSHEEYFFLNSWMKNKFISKGCRIDAVYFCPYHPKKGIGIYKRESKYRKPNPGMFFLAEKDLNIDLNKSIMVGNSLDDIKAANAAGISKVFLFNNNKISNERIKNYTFITDLRLVIKYLID